MGWPRRFSRGAFERVALILVWAAVAVFFSVLPATSTTFPTLGNAATIFGSQAVIVVLTLGLIIPMTAGDFDISVAYNLTLSSMIVAILNVNDGWPIAAAIGVALLAGVVIGLTNGFFAVLVGIDPFIATLGTGTVVGGIVFWISNSNTISGISSQLVHPVILDRVFGIPLEFFYALVLALILWYVFEFTPMGRRLLIVGRSRSVARLSGIRVRRVRWGAFVASGLISAIAGVMYAGSSGAADPTSGTTFLLPAFAGAFLGATTIMPGRYNPWGSVVATYFLVTGITGLELLGASSYVQDLFYGGALVGAVSLSQVVRRSHASEV